MSLAVSGANTHDSKLLNDTLDAVATERPAPNPEALQHLCLDAGFIGSPCEKIILAHNYVPHVKPRNVEAEELTRNPGAKARRWVVERAHSWLNRFRKLLVSFEKKRWAFLGLLRLACALVAWRQTIVIHG